MKEVNLKKFEMEFSELVLDTMETRENFRAAEKKAKELSRARAIASEVQWWHEEANRLKAAYVALANRMIQMKKVRRLLSLAEKEGKAKLITE